MTDITVQTQNGLFLDSSEHRRLRNCDGAAGILYGETIDRPLAREPVPVEHRSDGFQDSGQWQFARARNEHGYIVGN